MRRLFALGLFAVLLFGQATLSVSQLKSFLASSVKLDHPDKQVAEYLKKIKLSEQLTERDVVELQAQGLGPKSTEALQALRAASANLPKPVGAPDAMRPATPAPPMPAPSLADQKRIIEEAREISLGYAKHLPDFICLQVTRRYYDPAGLDMYSLMDTLATRLSYFGQKEEYKVISVNGNLSNVAYENLGGATSSGEFGTMLKEIFEPQTETEFRWERWGKLRGRIVHVYSYHVSQARSQWTVSWQKQLSIRPAYGGLLYVDRDVPVVMRVTLEAEAIPPTFPIQEVRSTLDYEYQDIAGKEFLLPLRAEMKMRESKLLAKNVVEFRNYRKFGAEATITYDLPEPLPDDKTTEKPPK